jgi:alanyl-tRNA synthetase
MGLNELREAFINYFESKDHYVSSSYPLVPKEDKSLLLINSGMAPLKSYFTGAKTPPKVRMATCQKCIRTGDIERVGKTARHATFFEMLGNFSFGDYFKLESLKYGWEFVTKVLEIPVEKLWVTVYLEDDDAYNIWKNDIGVPEDRIVRLGKADNFWEIGTGPCGPCSEIYIDRGPKYACSIEGHKPGCDCDQYIEFWNHVFTQFNRTDDGRYEELEKKNIDTGMGLERLAAIMQEVDTIYEIDTNKSILTKVEEISGKKYGNNEKNDVSIRIITDHIKAVTFMISDGILPNNEGRGYVLRRLLRRASRHGKLIGIDRTFLIELVDKVIENYGKAYENLVQNQEFIKKVVSVEESKFHQTIDQGMIILDQFIEDIKAKNSKILDGERAFKLYDTYGFPIDLTEEILEDNGLKVDHNEFAIQMDAQKKRAREARLNQDELGWENNMNEVIESLIQTDFIGYDSLECESKLLYHEINGENVNLVFDKSVFYALSGGQVGDKGTISSEGLLINIFDVTKVNKTFIHHGKIAYGTITEGQTMKLTVLKDNREAIKRNHTMTHVLHKALKMVLGEHVSQAGSLVDEFRLRFDFTHFEHISKEDLEKVENIVNENIMKAHQVNVTFMDLAIAKQEGAMALFDEKYEDNVRVVKVGDFSTELCGGTHLDNTGKAGAFKIISENGIAAGVRRIEALTGFNALNYFAKKEKELQNAYSIIKSKPDDFINKLELLTKENKMLSKEVDTLLTKIASSGIDKLINNSFEYKGIRVIFGVLENVDQNTLRDLSDKIKDKVTDSFIALFSKTEDKISIISSSSQKSIDAGLLSSSFVKNVSAILEGSGGGRPNLAQGAGKNLVLLDNLINNFKNDFEKLI